MTEDIIFLREKAAALRDLAQRAPSIARDLRRLADELDAKAAEMEQSQEGSSE
jgi:hypothetical protein